MVAKEDHPFAQIDYDLVTQLNQLTQTRPPTYQRPPGKSMKPWDNTTTKCLQPNTARQSYYSSNRGDRKSVSE
jgi:hypothetical protein